ncbi:MAG TPA: hypothetical protein VJT32_03045 [bacterium]|nr:hypothetical protein [bacterium]
MTRLSHSKTTVMGGGEVVVEDLDASSQAVSFQDVGNAGRW